MARRVPQNSLTGARKGFLKNVFVINFCDPKTKLEKVWMMFNRKKLLSNSKLKFKNLFK